MENQGSPVDPVVAKVAEIKNDFITQMNALKVQLADVCLKIDSLKEEERTQEVNKRRLEGAIIILQNQIEKIK